jgi:galactosamine-6-phosphate isomerase
MNILYCADYEEMSQKCSSRIIDNLTEKPNQLLCAATGNSPERVYKNLSDAFLKDPEVFQKLTILKLDEWGGIVATDPNSCETFIQQKILRPLSISSESYISFASNAKSPERECGRIQDELQENGPIDLCILGLGKNGHIGFNEPSDKLIPHCHVAQLSKESLQHQMVVGMEGKPTYGLTLGMADILQSEEIILLITGTEKEHVMKNLLTQNITTRLPASLLWLHPNVHCFIDSNAI